MSDARTEPAHPGIVTPVRALLVTVVVALVAATPPSAFAGEIEVHGFVLGRAARVDAPRSWLEDGLGRLTDSGRGGDPAARATAQIQAAVDWRPSPLWTAHVHGLARAEPDRAGGSLLGVAEAYLQFRPELTPRTTLRLRAGALFPGTSRENTERLWSSAGPPTLSALNSWIAEEVRPAGLEAALTRRDPASGGEVQLAAMVFAGSDTAGTLLAWRGWALGDRLSTVGEVLPLPPLPSLASGGSFARQRDDGTTPIAELDGRPGWLARTRWSKGGAGLQVAWMDNQGDRRLHRGQYAWRTRFLSAGADVAKGPLTLSAEAAAGRSGMGSLDKDHVDIGFRTAYVLASLGRPRVRVWGRFDTFRNVDEDHTGDAEDESGHAWTLAGAWSPAAHVRLVVEGIAVRAARSSGVLVALGPPGPERRLQGELRISF